MNETGKHIVVLTPGFAADEDDTTCIPSLQNLVKYYAMANPEDKISIISFQYPFTTKSYTWHNVQAYALGGRNKPFPSRILVWINAVSIYRKINRESKVDIIHSFWLNECTLVGQYLSSRFKIKMFATAMGQDCRSENRYLRLLNFKQFQTVCLSEFLKKNLEEAAGKHCDFIIPFGLPDNVLIPDLKRERKIDILGAGSLVAVKNYPLFIEIIAALKSEFPELKVLILGNTPDQDVFKKIRRMITDLKLEQNVTLAGEVAHSKVLEYMQKAKILLHTSSFEGQSMVITEGLTAGMTVVCLDVGRFPSEKTIVCNDKGQMVEALRNLLKKESPDYFPVKQPTVSETVQAYYKLYHNI